MTDPDLRLVRETLAKIAHAAPFFDVTLPVCNETLSALINIASASCAYLDSYSMTAVESAGREHELRSALLHLVDVGSAA